ncbi:MAG TPA: hypothetical protein VHB19_06395 [Devosia sp.]|nr:hypothetical protein [Devosia sp.]
MAVVVIAVAAALGGCARPIGDFGRAEADPLHDQMMPTLGTARAMASREPVSSFNLTDQEREMRDRIWRYLVAPHAYDWFGDIAVELQRTRILPISTKAAPTDKYYRWLHGTAFASSRVRYSRLGDDITADIALMPAAFAAICAVQQVDRQRGIAANGMPQLEDRMRADAAARQAENQAQIDWFVRAVTMRYSAYNYALDHLLVETPHDNAVAVNGLLSDLDVYVEAAQRGDFCNGTLPGGHSRGAPALRSRYLHSDMVVKGS